MAELTSNEVLKRFGGASRGTLTRWMNPDYAREKGIEPFPSGRMVDGRTKVWETDEVERWRQEQYPKLMRHVAPKRSRVDRSTSVELTLGQAYEAAKRVAQEDDTGFDYGEFEECHIEPMTAAFFEALRSRGTKGAVWMGDKFAFIFPEGDEGDRQAVAFKLAFG